MLQYPGCGVSCVAKVASLREIGTDLLSHLLCSSPKRRRRPPFCTVCTASRAGRTDAQFSMLYAFVSRRKGLLLVVHGRVQRCPRLCATLFVAVCNVAHAHGQRASPVSEMDFPSLQMASCLVRTISRFLPVTALLIGLDEKVWLGFTQ